ncbi:hypothetical protein PVAP13_4NG234000 [Panicum virgatum]|uniref:Uncharacterized protein n=1 Tax=Panicum virgatum TaxID=38727 RepID=A0A8T0TGS1_PANVG|nr:hypothetical protein PVAP13_4NG234000 [Panicum virgatum]
MLSHGHEKKVLSFEVCAVYLAKENLDCTAAVCTELRGPTNTATHAALRKIAYQGQPAPPHPCVDPVRPAFHGSTQRTGGNVLRAAAEAPSRRRPGTGTQTNSPPSPGRRPPGPPGSVPALADAPPGEPARRRQGPLVASGERGRTAPKRDETSTSRTQRERLAAAHFLPGAPAPTHLVSRASHIQLNSHPREEREGEKRVQAAKP